MPVYNVQEYVEAAIKSVLNQTYKDFELIIVDDGSTDKSSEVISKYRSDSRVKIVSQKNRGLSAARNTGLKYAKGSYVYFIDSDDLINHNLFQLAIDEFNTDKELDLISFGYKEFEGKVPNPNSSLRLKKKEVITSNKSLRKLMDSQIYQMAWSYIVKAKIIFDNNIRFSEGKLFEDNNSAAKIFSNCEKIEQANIEPAPYLLRYRSTSITAIANNLYSLRELEDELFIFEDQYNVFLNKGNKKTVSKAHTWYFKVLNRIYIKYYLSLYRNHTQKFLSIRKKVNMLYSEYETNLTFRDKERWLRVNSRIFDKFIRIISGDRRKLQ